MKTKSSVLINSGMGLFLAILFIISGCRLEVTPYNFKQGGTQITISGNISGTIANDGKLVNCNQNSFTPANYTYNGEISNLGKLMLDQSQTTCTSCKIDISQMSDFNYTTKWVFEGGDMLYATELLNGHSSRDQSGLMQGIYNGNSKVLGGTGKFKEATGYLKSTHWTVNTNQSNLSSFEGTIIIY